MTLEPKEIKCVSRSLNKTKLVTPTLCVLLSVHSMNGVAPLCFPEVRGVKVIGSCLRPENALPGARGRHGVCLSTCDFVSSLLLAGVLKKQTWQCLERLTVRATFSFSPEASVSILLFRLCPVPCPDFTLGSGRKGEGYTVPAPRALSRPCEL